MLVADTCRHVLRRGVIELLRSGFQCAVVGHYQPRMDKIEIHRGTTETASHSAGEAVVGLPVETQRWGEIYLVMIGYRLVESIMRIAYRQVEREVDTAHPVFKLRGGIYRHIVGVDHVLGQSGQFRWHIWQLRVHRAEITLYTTFEAEGYPLDVESICRALVGVERMVGDMLAESFAIDVKIERLRQRLPFIYALECDKMRAFETLDELEFVGDIIIGELRRL